MVLDANLPDGYEPVSAGITIPEPDQYEVTDDGSIVWTMKVQRLIRVHIDIFNAAFLVIGKNRNEASGRLADEFQLIKPPDISMSPFWWPWLPVLPIQIHFSIVSP